MAKRWYVVHTYSGHESKVKRYLENAVSNAGMEDWISRVVVPTEEIVEMRNGKKVTQTRKFLPSYVLVEMEMTKDTWHIVTSTPGVTNFVGAGKKPHPLRESEVIHILGQIDRGGASETIEIPFQVGDRIKVIDGPFSDFSGVVDEINPEKSKVKVMVSIFGRATPVELDVLQVEALPDED